MCSKPGDLAASVDALAAARVQELPLAALQELVELATSASRRLDGVASRALGELQVRGGGQVPDPAVAGATCPTPAWLRSAAKVAGSAAGRAVRTAVALRDLPAVQDAIVDGQLTVEHGRVLARLVGKIEPQALLDSQDALVEVARRTDPDQLAQFVRHLLATWCEPDLEAEEASAEDARFLTIRNKHNGRWRLTGELPDAAMESVLTVLEVLARRDGDADTRTAGQRRADALADVFGLALRHGDLPDAGGSRPRLTFVLPAEWAVRRREWVSQLGIGERSVPGGGADQGDCGSSDTVGAARGGRAGLLDLDQHPGRDCASAPWTGPATRVQIEALLCDARVEQLVLDEAGQVVSLTSRTGEITAAQRRAVAARDRCCTAKGCSRPPAFCDVHHLRARVHGGSTALDNLVLLCRRHHVMWHRERLTLIDLRVPWKRLPQPRAPALE